MTRAGASLFYFGIYVLLLGMLFIFIPNQLVAIAKLPPIPVGWARIIGLLALIVATCDIISGKHNIEVIIRASIYIRLGFLTGIILLVVFRQMPATTIIFGLIDALGAIWTAMSLRTSNT